MTNEDIIKLLDNEKGCTSITVTCKYENCRVDTKTVSKNRQAYKIKCEESNITLVSRDNGRIYTSE